MKALLQSLNEAERALVRETESAHMLALDEDALVDLHSRVRRARNTHVKKFRREAHAHVAGKGGGGIARPKNRRIAGKVEVFEAALARVSRRLAAAAKQSAADLKAERITAARKHRRRADLGTGRRDVAGSSGAARRAKRVGK